MLASLLPAAMAAAFDKCARPNGEWAGFDQANGESYAYAVAHSGNHVYVGGRGMGSLSYATSHNNGDYHDHIGTHAAHQSHTDVAAAGAHHETGSFAAPDDGYPDAVSSRYGMDNFIYKLSETGQPVSVYAMDVTTSDGKTDGTSENDYPYSYPYGLDGIEGEPDMIVVGGAFFGRIKFPKADGTTIDLVNRKFSWYDGYVAKIDMATKSVVWASSDHLEGRGYFRTVVTTAAGHVITATDTYDGKGYTGNLTKFNGLTGALVWQKNFGKEINSFRDVKLSASGEKVYVTGAFKGKDLTTYAPALATMTSCDDGEKASAVVAEFDVAPTDGPVAQWVTHIGCGNSRGAKGTFIEGDYLYVVGELSEPSDLLVPADGVAADACKLAGDLGGFLVKLKKDTGKCVWAKDLGATRKVVANADFVWTQTSDDDPFTLDADHTVVPSDRDSITAKFKALDGVGLWGAAVGGSGRDWGYDFTMTPTGPVTVGYSQSSTLSMGAVTATNLQKQAAQAADTAAATAMFVMQISTTDVVPSCLTCPADGDLTDATVNANKCFADGQCIDNGGFSTVNECFRCDPSAGVQKSLTTVVGVNHCFIDGKCKAKDDFRPSFRSYNTGSVCETCQPTVDGNGWSPVSGFWQDQKYAGQTGASHDCGWTSTSRGGYSSKPGPCAPNNYGILFTRNTQGCQVLPEVTMPTTKSTGLQSALANPSAGTELARITSAIAAAQSATSTEETGLTAAWYSGDTASCEKVAITGADTTAHGPCQNTPAAHADAMAALFDTNMHYGHSVARIKVQQALAILHDDLAPPKTTTAPQADIKMDILAHMLIPMYQGAIKAAYDMDNGGKAAARDAGLAYWNMIHPNVPGFNADDKARLVALFGPSASGANNNYCEVKAILHRNLPGSSMLQYGQKPHVAMGSRSGQATWDPSGLPTASAQHLPHKYDVDSAQMAGAPGSTHGLVDPDGGNTKCWSNDCNPVAEPVTAVEVVHLQERDIGTLKDASTKECTYPPPSPPPAETPSWVGATVVLTLTASGSVSDYSNLRDLTEKIATAAGLASSLVTISVAAASVIITATINVPAALTAASVQTLLSSKLGTAATASAALGIDVESDPTMIATEVQQESSDSGLTDGEIAGVAIGATVGGIVLLGLVGLILRSIMFKEAKPVFTCLEKAPAKSPA
jgi:hypothetical protein